MPSAATAQCFFRELIFHYLYIFNVLKDQFLRVCETHIGKYSNSVL